MKIKLFSVVLQIALAVAAQNASAGNWIVDAKVIQINESRQWWDPAGNGTRGDADHGGIFVTVDKAIPATVCGIANRTAFFTNVKKSYEQLWYTTLLAAHLSSSRINIYVDDECGPNNYPLITEVWIYK